MIIRQEIENYLWELHKDKGYSRVWTPHITNLSLYETSGHAEKFGDELFRVKGGDEDFALKPMNCPHHMQIYADDQFSYRDLPIRYFEPATVYRYEKSGQLSGLTRVRVEYHKSPTKYLPLWRLLESSTKQWGSLITTG
jgi:threonyl-tRNA synthetase